jgi:hypothetical protein
MRCAGHSLLVAALLSGSLISTGCGWRGLWRAQSEHYVDGELVTSEPVHSRAYESYMRARIAMEQTPPDLESARLEIHAALAHDGNDPHLWTTLAEIEAAVGDAAAARQSVARALALAPEYPPAVDLEARLRGGDPSSGSQTARSPTRGPG